MSDQEKQVAKMDLSATLNRRPNESMSRVGSWLQTRSLDGRPLFVDTKTGRTTWDTPFVDESGTVVFIDNAGVVCSTPSHIRDNESAEEAGFAAVPRQQQRARLRIPYAHLSPLAAVKLVRDELEKLSASGKSLEILSSEEHPTQKESVVAYAPKEVHVFVESLRRKLETDVANINGEYVRALHAWLNLAQLHP